jgi:hypothetical protein
MKKILMFALLLGTMQQAEANPDDAKKKRHVPKASKIINPKIGLMMTNVTDAPALYKTKAKLGLLIGSDLRFGKRLYFQPGVFYKQEGSVLIYNDGTVEQENNITKNSICVKTQLGYYLVNKEGFRLRMNVGPSYDVALSQKVVSTLNTSSQDWFNASALNLEGGLGLDIWFLSLDAGYTYGLGDAFRSGLFSNTSQFANSKLVGAYISAGIVIPYQKK